MAVKKVLIANQSTIPPYRVPFYQAVERLRPKWWEFSVVYDEAEARRHFFSAPERASFDFRVEDYHTYRLRLGGKQLLFQAFPFRAWRYDLIIVGSELKNLSYPLSSLWRFGGKAVAYWGHGQDYTVQHASGLKGLAERAKIWLPCRADGFFAYTRGVHDYVTSKGVNKKRVHVVYNTIDLEEQRRAFNRLISNREMLRKKGNLCGKKVLLYVGRLNRGKRLEFLTEAFSILREKDSSYHLILVGGGDPAFVDLLRSVCGNRSVSYHGPVFEAEKIGPSYIVSDLYVFPGNVGLGPLQSLCFDLTPVVIDSPNHKPEYEYLNTDNSLILPRQTTAECYADAIDSLLRDRATWAQLRSQAWPSIQHLTVENMANNFIRGINAILSRQEGLGIEERPAR